MGQVFARHIHLAGSNVTFLARDERARSIRHGLVLYELNKRDARNTPIPFSSFDVLTQESQLDSHSWDQIYMCVPSDALSDSLLGWIQNYGGEATIIKLQPGLRDRELYAAHFEEVQLVTGMLSLISYQAPLNGEEVPEPGMAYWFPPMLPILFSGSAERVSDVIKVLKTGGLPARYHPDVERLVGYVLAVEAPLTAGIECAGWSIGEFRRSRWFEVAYGAIKEASEVVSHYRQTSRPAVMALLRPMTLRLAISLLPKQRPVPLELYLKHHFTKLHAQSQQHIDDYINVGMEYGRSVVSLKELRHGLDSSLSVA